MHPYWTEALVHLNLKNDWKSSTLCFFFTVLIIGGYNLIMNTSSLVQVGWVHVWKSQIEAEKAKLRKINDQLSTHVSTLLYSIHFKYYKKVWKLCSSVLESSKTSQCETSSNCFNWWRSKSFVPWIIREDQQVHHAPLHWSSSVLLQWFCRR